MMNNASKFAVEGHGAGVLTVRGNDANTFANRWTLEAKLSRQAAWETAKGMMRTGDYHTVHVKTQAYASDAVFTAWHDSERGVWVNSKTCEVIDLSK